VTPVTPVAHLCRNCGAELHKIVLDLGVQPLANSYPASLDEAQVEPRYPLRLARCDVCCLVQLADDVDPSLIFDDHYAYFSSVSESWLEHADRYAAAMKEHLQLGANDLVVEIASNDGYLLRSFVDRGVPVLGIDPSGNVAASAVAAGVPTRVEFFGVAVAESLRAEGLSPSLVVGNNVLAHVPDLDDFVRGLAILAGESALVTLEFPHLLQLLRMREFDTIYHEHYSYFSLSAASDVFGRRGLQVVDVEQLPTHGGSLRVHLRCAGTSMPSDRVRTLLEDESASGLGTDVAYDEFAAAVSSVRTGLVDFLQRARAEERVVVGYGAPAKGNTLLNYCAITPELVEFTVDRSPVKQGRLLPGTHLPIRSPERLIERRPDYVLVLPWNVFDEIRTQMAAVHEWGGRFVVPIPTPRVVD
jgi:hypothetical protein